MSNAPDKILIVDDDPGMIRSLGRILADYPQRQFAMSGAQALQQTLAEPPDLILLDAQLPDMSGFAVCRALKDDARFKSIPVIFITGQCDERTEAMVFELGAEDFIAKPVSALVVRARVATQLRLRRATMELQRLARTDTLTGVSNRRFFDERLAAECQRALRGGTPLSVALLDVDHFKAYNDHHGHPAGDKCLREVAAAIREGAQRPDDVVARWGGEEFAVLLPATDAAGAAAMGVQLLQALALRALPHGRSAVASVVTASSGLSTFEPREAVRGTVAEAAAALVTRADQALYAAKAAGRAQAWQCLTGQAQPRLIAALPRTPLAG